MEDELIQDILTRAGKQYTPEDIQQIKNYYQGNIDNMIADLLSKSGKSSSPEDILAIKQYYKIGDQPVAAVIDAKTEQPEQTVGQPTVSEKPVFGPTISQGPANPFLGNETIAPIDREPDRVDYTIEAFIKAVNRGLAQGDLAEIGIDAMNLQTGEFTEDQIAKMAEANKRIERNPLSAETVGTIKAVNEGEYSKAFKLFATNPQVVVGELFTQSIVSLVKSGAKKVLAAMGTGASIGAGAGSMAGGVGAIPGAIGGIGYGFITGMGVASYQLEAGLSYVDSINEAMIEHNLDPTKPEDWKALFQNVDALKSARAKAETRGLVIAAFDMAMGRLAGVVAGTGKSAARVLAAAGIEFVGEPLGEAAAQIASGEELDPGEIVAEALGGGGGPVYTTAQVIGSRAQESINNKILNKKDKTPLAAAVADGQENELKAEIDFSEAVKETTSQQAQELREEVDRLSELKETIPEDLAPEQKRDILNLIDQRNEIETQVIDPAFEDRRSEQIKKINEQIRKIANESPKPEERQNELVQTPPVAEAMQEREETAQSITGPIKSDFDDTLFNPRTGQLTSLGQNVKERIANGEDVTILSARENTPENVQLISQQLGITPERIKLGLTPEQKAANLKEGDVFFDNNDQNIEAARSVPGVNVRKTTPGEIPFAPDDDIRGKEVELTVTDSTGNKTKIKFPDALEAQNTIRKQLEGIAKYKQIDCK